MWEGRGLRAGAGRESPEAFTTPTQKENRMSTLTLALIKAQIMKLHRKSNACVIEAMGIKGPRSFFLFRRAWALYNRAETLQEMLP